MGVQVRDHVLAADTLRAHDLGHVNEHLACAAATWDNHPHQAGRQAINSHANSIRSQAQRNSNAVEREERGTCSNSTAVV